MSLADTKPISAEQFLESPYSKGFELVDGELVELHMGAESSLVGGEFFAALRAYAKSEGGTAFPCEAGIQCFAEDAQRVRKPDACFFVDGRLTEGVPSGWLREAPDLAVEVVSPRDNAGELQVKIDEYLTAGVRLIWVAYPGTRTVQVYRPSGESSLLHANGTLTGEDVLPGFECRVGELFPQK